MIRSTGPTALRAKMASSILGGNASVAHFGPNIVPAFPHTDTPYQHRTLTINGVTVPYSRQSVYSGIATLAGQPSTAFPVDLTNNGLPIGLQAMGPYLEDRTPIRFASLVTRELGGYLRPPDYDEHL